MKAAIFLTSTVLSVGTLGLNFTFPATAQGLFDMPGQEHIDRGTMDRNRRSRGQDKTLWGNSDDSNVSYAERAAKIATGGKTVNVRTGPGFNYEVVTQVPDGRPVGAIGNTADGRWTQLKCGDCPPGGEIWIFSDFVRMR